MGPVKETIERLLRAKVADVLGETMAAFPAMRVQSFLNEIDNVVSEGGELAEAAAAEKRRVNALELPVNAPELPETQAKAPKRPRRQSSEELEEGNPPRAGNTPSARHISLETHTMVTARIKDELKEEKEKSAMANGQLCVLKDLVKSKDETIGALSAFNKYLLEHA